MSTQATFPGIITSNENGTSAPIGGGKIQTAFCLQQPIKAKLLPSIIRFPSYLSIAAANREKSRILKVLAGIKKAPYIILGCSSKTTGEDPVYPNRTALILTKTKCQLN
jgi:hypothetical protein